MKPKSSSPCSQQPANSPYPEQDASSPHLPTLFLQDPVQYYPVTYSKVFLAVSSV